MEREKCAFFFSPPSFPFARSSNMATSSIAARSLLALPPKKTTSVGQSARNLDSCDRKKKDARTLDLSFKAGLHGSTRNIDFPRNTVSCFHDNTVSCF